MFFAVFNLTYTPLYLYANAGLLFDLSLVKTSRALLCALLPRYGPPVDRALYSPQSQQSLQGVFAVGRSTNVTIRDWESILPANIAALVPELSAQEGEDEIEYYLVSPGHGQFTQNSVDVQLTNALLQNDSLETTTSVGLESLNESVVNSSNVTGAVGVNRTTSGGHFPWHAVPEFVVGSSRHAKWLVAHAMSWNISLAMDLSKTVRAVNQVLKTPPPHDLWSTWFVNHGLIEKDFNATEVKLCRLPWYSALAIDHRVTFAQRTDRPESCWGKEITPPVKRRKNKTNSIRQGAPMRRGPPILRGAPMIKGSPVLDGSPIRLK